jgi:hypothetical protein
MRVVLTDHNSKWQIDTPDAGLVGPWLKTIFDDFAAQSQSGGRIHWYNPVQFQIEVSG